MRRRTKTLAWTALGLAVLDLGLFALVANCCRIQTPEPNFLVSFDIWSKDEWALGRWGQLAGEPVEYDLSTDSWRHNDVLFQLFSSYLTTFENYEQEDELILPEIELSEDATWSEALAALRNLGEQGQCHSFWRELPFPDSIMQNGYFSMYTVHRFQRVDGTDMYCRPGQNAERYIQLPPNSVDDRLNF